MSDRVGRLYIEFSADGRPYIKGLKDLDQETDKTGRRLTSTWKSVGAAAAGAAVGGLAGLALAVQKVGLYAIKTAASFEYEMSRVKANANGTAAEMNKLRDVVLQLGKDTAFSAGETAQAANELIKAGFTIEQTMASLAGTLDLAAAGELSVAQAAEITANTLSQFSLKAKDAGMVADVLANAANLSTTEVTGLGQSLENVATIAAGMGWTLQETNAALALLANNGVKGAVAGTALKSMLMQLMTPTDQARKAMERYGISLYDANGNAVEAAELIRRLQDAFVGLSDADRDLAAGVIFGSYGIRAANILIKEGAAAFDEMTAAVGRTGAAQDIAATKLDNLYGSWEQLKGAVETLTINLGTTLLPKVREFVDELTGIVDYAIETGDWSGVGERVAVLLGEGIKTAAPYVASAVWELVKAAASGTGEAVAAFLFGMDLGTDFNKQRDYIAKRMADAYRDLPRTDAFQRAMEDLQSNWFTGAWNKGKEFNVPKAKTRGEVLALAAAFGLTLTDAGVAIVAENNARLYKRLVEGEGVTGGSIWSPGQEGLYGARIKELAAAEVELAEAAKSAARELEIQAAKTEHLEEISSQLSATYTTMTDPAAIWDEAKGSLDSYLAKMDDAIAAWGDFEGNLKLLATKFGPEFGADVIMKAAELGPEFVAALVGAKPEVVRKALGGLESHLGQNMDALSRHLNALCIPVGASAADTMWAAFAEGYQKSQAAKLAYTWGLQLKQGLVSGWNAGPAPVVQIRTPQGGSVAVPAFRAWGGWVGSYDSGGWIGRDKGLPAPEKSTGHAVPIIAHEGEYILTKNQADWLAGPVGSYAIGGQISASTLLSWATGSYGQATAAGQLSIIEAGYQATLAALDSKAAALETASARLASTAEGSAQKMQAVHERELTRLRAYYDARLALLDEEEREASRRSTTSELASLYGAASKTGSDLDRIQALRRQQAEEERKEARRLLEEERDAALEAYQHQMEIETERLASQIAAQERSLQEQRRGIELARAAAQRGYDFQRQAIESTMSMLAENAERITSTVGTMALDVTNIMGVLGGSVAQSFLGAAGGLSTSIYTGGGGGSTSGGYVGSGQMSWDEAKGIARGYLPTSANELEIENMAARIMDVNPHQWDYMATSPMPEGPGLGYGYDWNRYDKRWEPINPRADSSAYSPGGLYAIDDYSPLDYVAPSLERRWQPVPEDFDWSRWRTYDDGGWLMPGLTLARNDTGVPERVVPPGGETIRLDIHTDGPLTDSQVARLADAVKESLARDRRHAVFMTS